MIQILRRKAGIDMIITPDQKELLKKLLPENADRLLNQSDAMNILNALDDLYLDLLDNDEPTEASRECERLRDHVHWNNFHRD